MNNIKYTIEFISSVEFGESIIGLIKQEPDTQLIITKDLTGTRRTTPTKIPPVERRPINKKRRRSTYHGKYLAPDGHIADSYAVFLLQREGGTMSNERLKRSMLEYYALGTLSAASSRLKANGIIERDKNSMIHLLKPDITQEEVIKMTHLHEEKIRRSRA